MKYNVTLWTEWWNRRGKRVGRNRRIVVSAPDTASYNELASVAVRAGQEQFRSNCIYLWTNHVVKA